MAKFASLCGLKVADTNPLETLEDWLNEAKSKNEIEPTACSLATVSKEGSPSVRIVLFKGIHEGQLAFVTNYESRKAEEIKLNPKVALAFYWKTLNRQVRVEGTMRKAPSEFSDAYWRSRARESQLSAWTSPQSREVKSYDELEKKLNETKQKFEGQEIPRPEFWGAYFLNPEKVELWIGETYRMHQRTLFTKENSKWISKTLGP